MKKLLALGLFLGLVISPAVSFGVSFSPIPQNMYWLGHDNYYSWTIDWNSTGQEISSVELVFTNLYDWTDETNDTLTVYLVDNPLTGGTPISSNVTSFNDNSQPGLPSALPAEFYQVAQWTDLPPSGPGTGTNVVFDLSPFKDIIEQYGLDGSFALVVDPDCIYQSDRISLNINSVPEPTTLILLGIGLVGVGFVRKRKLI